MAAIDKTYISDWNVFDKIRNWAIKQEFTLKNGQVIKLIDYLYYPNLTKEEWDEMHDERIKYAEKHYNTPEYIAECKKEYGNDWEFNAENYFDVVQKFKTDLKNNMVEDGQRLRLRIIMKTIFMNK